jgi:hypothetical protein
MSDSGGGHTLPDSAGALLVLLAFALVWALIDRVVG